ncbi:hypothetical protein BHM03_00013385 [Ensete ventricosum]|uniref:Transcription termination factor MTERF9, chloroplastic n=1 Tax=Ensete ventricosum TaxID=4639 RepID=A0A445MDV0_ENSVE|nr:hypothetical protein BHM03_00013385 [Ensete ventricosum]
MYTNSQRIFCSHLDKKSAEMAMLCFPPKSSPLFFSASSSSLLPSPSAGSRRFSVGFAVFSSHSNPRILKSTRRSRTGRLISPYDDEDDEKDDDEEEDEDESEEEVSSSPSLHLHVRLSSKVVLGTKKLSDRYDDLSDVEDQFPSRKLSKIYSTEPNRKPGTAKVYSRRILMRQPQILEYTVENNLKSHVAFLVSIGVPHSRLGQIITAAPSLFSYSIEHSLKPTVRYLVEEVGIKTSDISKVVQLSPQVLVQRIDNSWTSRFSFLSKELGAPKDSVVKMVTKHPQLLHYSIEDGILPRINFLRSIGMCNSDILKVLTSLTQVLSLSLERNLKPKYLYLVDELRNEVKSLTKYPMYLSLSLEQRIRPRHRFLVSLKKAPKGPFPLSSLVPSDECFCQQWAGTSLEKYLAFRQSLQLTDFAKKYQRKA